PPRHNFTALPRIRSESPAFDLHHPEIARHDQKQHSGRRDAIDAPGHEGQRS
ncbi:cytochrome c oxidase subunit I, partial [Streptomyces sp. NPDC102270]